MSSPRFWKHHVRRRATAFWLALTGRSPVICSNVLRPGDRALYVSNGSGDSQPSHDYDHPGRTSTAAAERLPSCLCTEAQLESPAFRYWIDQLGEEFSLHRKHWELAYVAQALYERGMLQPGRRGLGFAVGQEPIPGLFAQLGCEILATDLDAQDKRSLVWKESGQHLSSALQRDTNGSPSSRRVTFRSVDMNNIPEDLTGFDFTWSTCSFEHCGSIRLGQEFIWNQMRCLKPGGIAIHTTEFNLTSDTSTLDNTGTVIFRRRDIEQIVQSLIESGHSVEPLSLDPGSGTMDRHIDWPPFSGDQHLRLMLIRYAATSIGLIIRKADSPNQHNLVLPNATRSH